MESLLISAALGWSAGFFLSKGIIHGEYSYFVDLTIVLIGTVAWFMYTIPGAH